MSAQRSVFFFFTILMLAATARATEVSDLLLRQQALGRGMGDLPAASQAAIRSDQERIEMLVAGKAQLSQLPAADRQEVRRLVARIDSSLRQGERDRLVCTQEARTGSNFVTRVCRTPEQQREQKDAADKALGEERTRVKCNERNGCT